MFSVHMQVISVICNRFWYTDHAGPDFPIDLCIASAFSRQIANGNAGPSLALGSMGAKPYFRCHLVNIASIYKQ